MPSIEPYKYLINGTGSNINTNVADAEQNIKKQIEELNAGYYKGMEVHLESYQVSYRNYFIYQTITAKVNCRIQMPVRPLWSSEYLNYYFSVIYDIPVTDSTEFIRNVDMAVDYLEKYGITDKIQSAMDKVKEFFGS